MNAAISCMITAPRATKTDTIPRATKTDTMRVVYVACPYSDPVPAIMKDRHDKATQYAAQLIEDGAIAFSPLTHSRPMVQYMEEHGEDWETWRTVDLAFLSMCTEIHVLRLPGWDSSVGVLSEVQEARRHGIKVIYV